MREISVVEFRPRRHRAGAVGGPPARRPRAGRAGGQTNRAGASPEESVESVESNECSLSIIYFQYSTGRSLHTYFTLFCRIHIFIKYVM